MIPNHIIPHLLALKKHKRTRRQKILRWSARCCAINAEAFPDDHWARKRLETIAAEQAEAADYAPHLPLTFR